jgi:MFS family permease
MGSFGRGGRLTVPLLAFLGVMAYALPMAVVSPALPIIGRELHVSPAETAWALTGMTLSASVGTPVIGRLGDLYGPRRVLLAVLPVGILGQVISALAFSMPMLLGGRVLAGLGSGVFPLAYTIIRVAYPPDRTASGIGLMSSMLALGGALSWVIAGPVIDHLGWRWLIWVPVAALVPGTLAAYWIVPKAEPEPGAGVDWWGAALFAAWMTAGLTALTQGVPWGWTSAGTLGLAGAAVVLALCWLLLESRIEDPLVDLKLMRVRGVWTANVGSLFAGYALMAAGLLFPLLIQLPKSSGFGFGGTATDTAFLALPASVAMTLAGLSAGRLDRLMGSRVVLLVGGGLVTAGYGSVVVAHDRLWHLVIANVLRGIGLGLAYAAVANLVVAAVPYGKTGVATGVNTLVRTVGAGLGTQVSAVLVAAFAVGAQPAEKGFTLAFAVCAILGVGLVIVALIAPRRTSDNKETPLVEAVAP